jgi:hypothetical protein
MIREIYSKDLVVNQNTYCGAPTGQVWWDGSTQRLKVVTGPGQSMDLHSNSANIEFRPEVNRILEWAERKMQEEDQLDQLCKKFPNLEEARREFEVLLALVKNRT